MSSQVFFLLLAILGEVASRCVYLAAKPAHVGG
jgi:hypothetical protein